MGESDEQYLAIGDQIAGHLESWAGLADGLRVVDVGCGYGRLAHALRRRRFAGRYLGLDVLERHVAWCRRHLGGRGWRFRHLDVRNARYNPAGALAPEELALGRYASAADLIVAASLFTHLESTAVRHYLREFTRVLSPRGRVYASFFVLDERPGAAMEFPYALGGGARCQYRDEPLRAVGYSRPWLEDLFARIGLEVERLSYGTWSPGAANDHYQDVFVLTARGAR